MKSDPIQIFWHVNAMPGWQDVFHRQWLKISSSQLLRDVKTINFCINGPTHQISFVNKLSNKFNIVQVHNSADLWEFPTLNYLHNRALTDAPFKALYIHFKGLTRRTNKNVIDWCNFLEWSTIEKWQESVDLLDTYDAVGPNWEVEPWPHFSGNLWWANSTYIKTLPKMWHPIDTINKFRTRNCYQFSNQGHWRFDYEAWIGTGNPKHYEIAKSFINGGLHYQLPFSEKLYR
jgi:hypothetical protein